MAFGCSGYLKGYLQSNSNGPPLSVSRQLGVLALAGGGNQSSGYPVLCRSRDVMPWLPNTLPFLGGGANVERSIVGVYGVYALSAPQTSARWVQRCVVFPCRLRHLLAPSISELAP